MSKEIKKLDEQELKKVKEQQEKLNGLLVNIGVLESQKHSLLHQLAEENKVIEETKKELEEKYGAININLADGTFEDIEKESE